MRLLLILSLFVIAGCASAVPTRSHHNSYEFQQGQAAESQQRLDRE